MAQIEQVYWKKYLIFFYFEMSGYLILCHNQEWDQKTTADQKVKNCVKLFHYRKGRVKTNNINVRIVLKAKQEIWRKSESWQIVLVCNKANINVTSAMKQILVLRVQ